MQEDFNQQLEAAKNWAAQAQAAGWLAAFDLAALAALENRTPASLFEAGAHRPLVAAFFGGTGVGKSTLLNRLAGQAIATAGVERPTSREVSLYLHESLSVRQLPPGFPVERVRLAHHADAQWRSVVWIDMPDIDSTEASNRELVADWLPHIDVLMYVVSPERYRDDKGWRLLREHVREHAWLFVMNQWDRGQDAQSEDFVKLLRQGGFAQPLLFRTDCRAEVERRKPDEFAALQAMLQSLADSHLIEQLEHRALASRREELRQVVGRALVCLGSDVEVSALREAWPVLWAEATDTLRKGLQWPMAEVARAFVVHESSPLRRSLRLDPPAPKEPPPRPPSPSILWDDWAQMQLQDALDRLLMEADSRRLPVAPLKAAMVGVAENASKLVLDEAQRALRASLAKPGNFAQRFLLKFTGASAVLLPLAAMGWVSWQAFIAYYESAQTHSGFLGADFAIHSGLLVAIAWLLPFFLHQQLKPSTERAALRGLRKGTDAGLARIALLAEAALSDYAANLQTCQQQAQNLLMSAESLPAPNQESPPGMLQRMIPADENWG